MKLSTELTPLRILHVHPFTYCFFLQTSFISRPEAEALQPSMSENIGNAVGSNENDEVNTHGEVCGFADFAV